MKKERKRIELEKQEKMWTGKEKWVFWGGGGRGETTERKLSSE
jgi:hypothetical protein